MTFGAIARSIRHRRELQHFPRHGDHCQSARRSRHGAYQYDAAGNMTHDANHTYFYDVENRTIQVEHTRKLRGRYRLLRLRRPKSQNTKDRRFRRHPVCLRRGWPGHSRGRRSRQFHRLLHPFAGQLLAQYKNSTTQFIHKDHLGSTRLVTGMTNPRLRLTLSISFLRRTTRWRHRHHSQIHRQERRLRSGLDNFGARFDSSTLGRFMSVDPDNASASSGDPQSWNAYSYVRNNPLSLHRFRRSDLLSPCQRI